MSLTATPTPGKGLLSPKDHVLFMIDFQSQMAFATKSIETTTLPRVRWPFAALSPSERSGSSSITLIFHPAASEPSQRAKSASWANPNTPKTCGCSASSATSWGWRGRRTSGMRSRRCSLTCGAGIAGC